jgi:molecular chaperone IbpA
MDGRFVRDRWPPIKIVATSGLVRSSCRSRIAAPSLYHAAGDDGHCLIAAITIQTLSNFFCALLKPNPVLQIFFVAILEMAHLAPSGASGLRRAPVLSGASYPSCSLEDLAMRTYDFSPLFRSTVGFDRLFDLVETAQRATEESYPPYNIERLAEDRYQISLAVAGFSPDEISITAEQNVVTIEGIKAEKAGREFLFRGISTRHFKRQFNLADNVQVKNAAFDNGLLKIEMVREIPEAMKPRRIAINGASAGNVQQIEAKVA